MSLSPDILPGIGEEPWEILRGRVELDTYGESPDQESPLSIPDAPIEKVVFRPKPRLTATPRFLPFHTEIL